MNQGNIERFDELTKNALIEEDEDKFINLLLERSKFSEGLVKNNVVLDKEKAATMLVQENRLSRRLEEERRITLQQMEQLSKSRKTIKAYSPKFPFPPMPVFFEKKL